MWTGVVASAGDAAFAAAVRRLLDAAQPFVPLDAALPQARLLAIVRQLRWARVLVLAGVDEGIVQALVAELQATRTCGAHGEVVLEVPPQLGAGRVAPGDLPLMPAYAVFTSGTTGVPKPVHAPYATLRSNAHAIAARLRVSAADRIVQATPVSFDPSLVEIELAHCTGAALIAPPAGVRATPHALAAWIVDRAATVLMCTPSFFNRFQPEDRRRVLQTLRVLVLGGEAFPLRPTVEQWIADGYTASLWNIYGTTECSSWASLQAVVPEGCTPEQALAHMREIAWQNAFPIGTALDDTTMEVRRAGDDSDNGGDMLWIGGELRRCCVGDERTMPPTMRNTGDCVRVVNGHIYVVGRIDRQVKRMGKRAQLDEIEAAMSTACPCPIRVVHQNHQLVAFVDTSHVADVSDEIEHAIDAIRATVGAEFTVDEVWSTSQPFPLNTNGKIDEPALLRRWDNGDMVLLSATRLHAGARWPSTQHAASFVCNLLSQLLGGEQVSTTAFFVALGGTSIAATRAANLLNQCTGIAAMQAYQVLLNEPVSALVEQVWNAREARGRSLSPDAPAPNKRPRPSSPQTATPADAGTSALPGMFQRCCSLSVASCPTRLRLGWSVDTGKCIDASPLIVDGVAGNSMRLLFVGSHSHRFVAVDVNTGDVLWQFEAGDRIESSAVLCGDYVVFGCYDANVYVLHAATGALHWRFQTQSQIKCSPVCERNVVFVGSHDGNVYALDVAGKRELARCDAGGSVFAISRVCASRLFVGTLRGSVLCAAVPTLALQWERTLDGPIFAMPCAIADGDGDGAGARVVVGTATGQLVCLAGARGDVLWQVRCGGPIFSSPCAFRVRTDDFVVLGCHDKSLKIHDSRTGQLLQSVPAPSAVFASPSVWQHCDSTEAIVLAYATDGTPIAVRVWAESAAAPSVRVDLLDLGLVRAPGEVFSSPTVLADGMAVGCRDNRVYYYRRQ